MECLGFENEPWCTGRLIGCSHCTEEGYICHENDVCSDALFRCNNLDQSLKDLINQEENNLNLVHPCNSADCSEDLTSTECKITVFNFCKNEDSTCTLSGTNLYLKISHLSNLYSFI